MIQSDSAVVDDMSQELSSKHSDPGMQVQGSGYRVQGSGYRVQGSGYSVQGLGYMVQGLGYRVQGLGSKVQGLGPRPPPALLVEVEVHLEAVVRHPAVLVVVRLDFLGPITRANLQSAGLRVKGVWGF